MRMYMGTGTIVFRIVVETAAEYYKLLDVIHEHSEYTTKFENFQDNLPEGRYFSITHLPLDNITMVITFTFLNNQRKSMNQTIKYLSKELGIKITAEK